MTFVGQQENQSENEELQEEGHGVEDESQEAFQTQMPYQSLRGESPRKFVVYKENITIEKISAKGRLDKPGNRLTDFKPSKKQQNETGVNPSPLVTISISKAIATIRNVVSNPVREEAEVDTVKKPEQNLTKDRLVPPAAHFQSSTGTPSLLKQGMTCGASLPRYVGKITNGQQELLNADSSWQPPLVGELCREGQVPAKSLEKFMPKTEIVRNTNVVEETCRDSVHMRDIDEDAEPTHKLSELHSSPPTFTQTSWSESDYGSPKDIPRAGRILPLDSSPPKSMIPAAEPETPPKQSQLVVASQMSSGSQHGRIQTIARDLEVTHQEGDGSAEDQETDTPKSPRDTLKESASADSRLKPSNANSISTSAASSLQSAKIVQVSRTQYPRKAQSEGPRKLSGDENMLTHGGLEPSPIQAQADFSQSIPPSSFMVPGTYVRGSYSKISPPGQDSLPATDSSTFMIHQPSKKKIPLESPEESVAKRRRLTQQEVTDGSEWLGWEQKLRQERRNGIARFKVKDAEPKPQPSLPSLAQVLEPRSELKEFNRSQDSSIHQWLEKAAGHESPVLGASPRLMKHRSTRQGKQRPTRNEHRSVRSVERQVVVSEIGTRENKTPNPKSKTATVTLTDGNQAYSLVETNIYWKYKHYYTTYEGSQDIFEEACDIIRKVGLHLSLWDDFVFRYHHEYLAIYVPGMVHKGHDPLSYHKYYDEHVTRPKCQHCVIPRDHIKHKRGRTEFAKLGDDIASQNPLGLHIATPDVMLETWRARNWPLKK